MRVMAFVCATLGFDRLSRTRWPQVSFVPLDPTDEDSMAAVLAHVDNSIQVAASATVACCTAIGFSVNPGFP